MVVAGFSSVVVSPDPDSTINEGFVNGSVVVNCFSFFSTSGLGGWSVIEHDPASHLMSFVDSLPNSVVCDNVNLNYHALEFVCNHYNIMFPHHLKWLELGDICNGASINEMLFASYGGNADKSKDCCKQDINSLANHFGISRQDYNVDAKKYNNLSMNIMPEEQQEITIKNCMNNSAMCFDLYQFMKKYIYEKNNRKVTMMPFVVADNINKNGIMVDKTLCQQLVVYQDKIKNILINDITTITEGYCDRMSLLHRFNRWLNYTNMVLEIPELEPFWNMNYISLKDEKDILERQGINVNMPCKMVRKYLMTRTEDIEKRTGVTSPHTETSLDALIELIYAKKNLNKSRFIHNMQSSTLGLNKHLLGEKHPNYELGQKIKKLWYIYHGVCFIKARSILEYHSSDDRLRFNYKAYGAKSGRFTSHNANIQNFSRYVCDTNVVRDIIVADINNETLTDAENIAKSNKNLLIPQKGYRFIKFDFSSFEMRTAYTYFVEQEGMTKVIKEGKDPYNFMISTYMYTALYAIADEERRNVAKIVALASLYNMGRVKLGETISKSIGQYVNDQESHEYRDTWMQNNDKVVKFRKDIYNNFALACMGDDIITPAYKMNLHIEKKNKNCKAVVMTLPSGRRIYYWGAEMRTVDERIILSYYVNKNGKISRRQFHEGTLFAHLNSGACQDIFCEFLFLVKNNINDNKIVSMTHDDFVIEVKEQEYDKTLSEVYTMNKTFKPKWLDTIDVQDTPFPIKLSS